MSTNPKLPTAGLDLAAYPPGFHERLRSRFVRQLIRDEPVAASTASGGDSQIPKVLVRFWHDFGAMPADVQACLDSWDGLRANGFEILTFDDASAAAYIAERFGLRHVEAYGRCWHPAMRCDYSRLCYLHASGGFYVDADDVMTEGRWSLLYGDDRLKLHPLCYSLADRCLVAMKDVWVTVPPATGHVFYVNNNPLVAPIGHPVLGRALERATAVLLAEEERRDIQATTGPMALTAALAAHARELARGGQPRDFTLLRDWDRVGETRWGLSYRADARNWRNVAWS